MKQSTRTKLAHRIPLFYGWVIVAGAFLGSFAGGGMQSFTFGVFMRPMAQSLGWARATMTGALTVHTLTAAALGPVVGPMVDRHGPRFLMVASAIAGGVACLLLSHVQEVWQFYLVYAMVGLAGGAGVGGLVSQATVVKWFVRRRGRATAFSTMGNTAAGTLLAPLVGFIIFTFDWRAAWIVLAGVFFGLLLPVSFLMVRQPEDVGLLPDGAKSREEAQAAYNRRGGHRAEHSWRLGEALRTRALWLLSISLVVGGLAVSSVVVHEFSFVTERGFSPRVAAAVLSTHAFMASMGRLAWGFLVERFPVRYCMAALYLGSALGVGLLLSASSVPMVFVFALVYGISVGGHAVLSTVVWADYFGRDFVGTIKGVLTPVTTGAVAFGPLLVGLGYDILGEYVQVFVALAALFLAGAALVVLAKPPDEIRAPAPAAAV